VGDDVKAAPAQRMTLRLVRVTHTDLPATPTVANNFVKSTLFSPDGTQVLVTSCDRAARLYGCVEGRVRLRLQYECGEGIYDAAWFPSPHPAARCFVTSVRDHPLQLWDADVRALRASYVPLDHACEPASALSCAFSATGARLFAGFENRVCIFDVAEPTAEPRSVTVYHRKFRPNGVQGLISCFATQADTTYAVGSYSGGVGLLDERSDEHAIAVFHTAHAGGVTQLLFSPNGHYLFSGARKDPLLICWDLRTQTPLCRFRRQSDTNQRLQFAVSASGQHLSTPSGRQVDVYDLLHGDLVTPVPCATHEFAAAVNSVSQHPLQPVLAVGTGERKPVADAEANRVFLMAMQ